MRISNQTAEKKPDTPTAHPETVKPVDMGSGQAIEGCESGSIDHPHTYGDRAIQGNIAMQGPKALYEQVKDYIMQHVNSGQWTPDTRIPSENQLVRELGVSRMTVNRALRELSERGHLVRIQGVGTYVAHPKPLTTLFEISSIDEEIRGRGGIHSSEVHLLREESAYSELAAAMEIPIGTPLFHSVIVHKNSGKPVMLADQYVNPQSAPDYLKQDFTTITTSRYLLSVAGLTDVEHIVEALLPDSMTRKLLNLEPHEPCLVLHRQTWDHQRVVTHSRMTYPGSIYRIGGRFKTLAGGYQLDIMGNN